MQITVVGLGGLGSWIAEGLVRSGFLNLILCDYDVVSKSNLSRQNYTSRDIKLPKVKAIQDRLKSINSSVDIEIFGKVDSTNVEELFLRSDLLIDATDNLETKYLINKFSVKLNKKWIFSAVSGQLGYVCLIDPSKFCLNCFYGSKSENVGNTPIETVWITSSLVITLVKKYLRGEHDNFLYHIHSMNIDKIRIKRKKSCPICSY